MDKINSKLLRSPQIRLSPSHHTIKSRFRIRKKSSSSENSCQNDTNSINSNLSLNSSQNTESNKKSDLNNIDADPVFNGLVNEGDLLIEHNGVMFNVSNNDRDVDNAWNFVKQLTNALRYLQDIVEKDILEQLPGAASILLEIVVSGYAKLRAHLIINEKSDLFILAKNKMCSSLAELIKWSDAFLLFGDSALDKKNVYFVINSVKDAVEELVKFCVDKHQRKIKLHSSSTEVTVSELNDQIGKLNLNHADPFVNIQYRSKPVIQNISSNCKNHNQLMNELNNFIDNHNESLNLEKKSKHKKSLPDLSNNQKYKNENSSKNITFSTPQSKLKGYTSNHKELKNSFSSESIFNEFIQNSNVPKLPKKPIDKHELNKKVLDNVPLLHTEFLENQTMNYCNIAQIVETDKCNQILLENMPPPLPPKKKNSLNLTNKVEQKQNLNLPKNALLVTPNSFIEKNKPNRIKSHENIKFFNSNTDNLITLNDFIDEFKQYSNQRKHHSENSQYTLKDFIKINQNLNNFKSSSNEINLNKQNDLDSTKDSFNKNNDKSINQDIFDGAPIVFRNKKNLPKQSSLDKKSDNLIKISENELKDYFNNFEDTNKEKYNQQNSRPSSQYDNLSFNEFPENNLNCHTSSLSTLNTYSSNNSNLPCNNCSINTVNTQNSLNISWQSNKFSSSNSSYNHLTSSNRSSKSSNNQFENDSQSSYDNDEIDNKPPPLPPKKKNISAYCQLFSSYTAPNDSTLAKSYRYSVHTVHQIHRTQSTYQQIELTFNQQKEFHNLNNKPVNSNNSLLQRNHLTASSITTSSEDSIISTSSFNSDYGKDTSSFILPPPLPPKKNSNNFILPEKPEAYRCKTQLSNNDQTDNIEKNGLSKIQYNFSKNKNELNLNEIKTANLKDFENFTIDFKNELNKNSRVRPDSSVSSQKSESGISSTQSIPKFIELEYSNNEIQSEILEKLDVQQYLIFKKETTPPTSASRDTFFSKKDNKKDQVLDEFKEELQGGPVDALIVKATEVSSNRKKDFLFLEAFLTTYRTFVSPTELINKLIYRFNKFIKLKEDKQMLARNAFALLVRVVDDLCLIDCNNELFKILFVFICSLVFGGDLVLAKVLRNKVLEKWKEKNVVVDTPIQPLTCISINSKQSSLLDFKSEHIAEQMTLFDNELFVKIEPAELLLWAREQKEEVNLGKFTEHFNKMSYWVRSRIIEENESKEREKITWKFIKVMKHLRKLNNFNSYLALLSALDSAPIRRLGWPKNITETLNDYSTLIDSSSSFKIYRQILEETEPPSIPYIGLILQDLTFVHVGNNDMLPDGQSVNFIKRWQIFNILDQLRKFRNSQYNFKKNDQILNLFNNFDNYLSEETIWQLSQQLKPKNKNPKK